MKKQLTDKQKGIIVTGVLTVIVIVIIIYSVTHMIANMPKPKKIPPQFITIQDTELAYDKDNYIVHKKGYMQDSTTIITNKYIYIPYYTNDGQLCKYNTDTKTIEPITNGAIQQKGN